MESLRILLTHFTDDVMTIVLGVLALVTFGIVMYWIYNRKKFHQLSHQIPAQVVKNYLDSIIQNSNALKSSLFRGGGLDVGTGIPSVLPVGDSVGGNIDAATLEELQRKRGEVSSLTQRVSEKEKIITSLEDKIRSLESGTSSGGSSEEVEILKGEVNRLQKELAAAKKAGGAPAGGDPEIQKKLDEVTRERDELKERLMEYEIIEEDLANLKRLQQENEKLKQALGKGGQDAAAPAPAPEAKKAAPPPPEPEEVAEEEAPAPEMEASEEEEKPKASKEDEIAPANEGEQKSAEELLSEFEKMLG